jgi:hypothetical protein
MKQLCRPKTQLFPGCEITTSRFRSFGHLDVRMGSCISLTVALFRLLRLRVETLWVVFRASLMIAAKTGSRP